MNLLKKELKSGTPKKEAFTSFCERGGNPKKGSKYIALLPDKEEVQTYTKLNYGLIAIYIVICCLSLYSLPYSSLSNLTDGAILYALGFSLIIPIVIIWLLYKQQALAYIALCFLMFKGIFDSSKYFEQDPTAVYIAIVIQLVIIGYAIYLKVKIFPFQNFFHTKKDTNGFFIYEKEKT